MPADDLDAYSEEQLEAMLAEAQQREAASDTGVLPLPKLASAGTGPLDVGNPDVPLWQRIAGGMLAGNPDVAGAAAFGQMEPQHQRQALEIGLPMAAGMIPGPQQALALPVLARLGGRLGAVALAGKGSSLAAESFDPSASPEEAQERSDSNARVAMLSELAGRGVAAAARPIARAAQTQGAKALGLIQSGFRGAGVPEARAMAQRVLDERNVISTLASGETMQGRAEFSREGIGKMLGMVRDHLDQRGAGVNAITIISQLRNKLLPQVAGLPSEPQVLAQLRQAEQTVMAYARHYGTNIPASVLETIKRDFAKSAGRDALQKLPTDKAWETSRAVIQDAEDSLVQGFLGPEGLARFKDLKGRYGALSDATEALKEMRAPRDVGNSWLPLTAQLFGGGALGFAAGGDTMGERLAGALGGALLTKFMYSRGNQIAAVTLNRLAKLAGNPATEPTLRAAAQAILQSQRAGDYGQAETFQDYTRRMREERLAQ